MGIRLLSACFETERTCIHSSTGAFLLSGLLAKYPSAIVYCIARAKTAQAAKDRVIKSLQAHLLYRSEYDVCLPDVSTLWLCATDHVSHH